GGVRCGVHELVVADIPGLIAGASEGKGLGHRFLRHIERSRVRLVLVDLTEPDGRSPDEQQRVLVDELARYRPDLLERPRVVAGSKADVGSAPWEGRRLSAVTGEGVDEVLGRLAVLVERARAELPADEGFVVLRPQEEGVRVEREGDHVFRVIGRPAERAVGVTDLTNEQALAYVHQRLRRLGVDRALARAGAREGDLVHVGGLTFEYQLCLSSLRCGR